MLLSDEYKSQVLAVRNEHDSDKQKRLKNKLPHCTPSAIFLGPRKNPPLSHTGFICIDIDEKDNIGVKGFDRLKESIAENPYILYCGHSTGGAGYFCMIEIAHPEKHREHFESLKADFARAGITIDPACSDVSRVRYVSYDPEPYINPEAKTYERVPESQRKRPKQTKKGRSGRGSSGRDTAVEVARLISMISIEEADITQGYTVWLEIGCALAAEFGEAGRDMFHAVSRWHPDYNGDECDAKFDECLKFDKYTIASFFHFCKEAGIDVLMDFRKYLKR